MSSSTDPYIRSLDCVHCGLCLPACPTYDVLGLETDSPRGRIYLMRAWSEGRVEKPASILPHLDGCLDCRACESACPSGVEYGQILENVRSEIALEVGRSRGARIRGWLLRSVVARQNRLRWAFRLGRAAQVLGLRRVAEALRLVPRAMRELGPPIPPGRDRRPWTGTYRPDGPARGRVALFTGCVMEQMFGSVNRATLQLLLANGFEVDVPAQQRCCGALLLHDGQRDAARALARENLAAFADADFIVNNSAGCGAAMKEYGELLDTPEGADFAHRCRDISEFLADVGLTATPARREVAIAYDDPCHLCHGQGVRAGPRQLLAQIPGATLVSHASAEDCCGSAGIYNLIHPQMAQAIGDKKAAALCTSGADLVATGNPGCMMQIRSRLRAAGSDLPVAHPAELLLPPDPPQPAP